MDVVLFRHAQKAMEPFNDPHLSAQGFEQAEKLPALVDKKQIPAPTELWISEKIRTRQTFQHLADTYKVPVIEKPELTLRQDFENRKDFITRIQKLIEELSLSARNSTLSKCVYLCTHYDWIEEAMLLIPSDTNLTTFEFSHWAPAHFVHFSIENENWRVVKKRGTAL